MTQPLFHLPPFPAEKKSGTALLLGSILTGFFAQIVLLLSSSGGAANWELSTWLPTLGDNASPLLGLMLYLAAGLLFIAATRQLTSPAPAFSACTQPRPARPPRFGFWLTSLGLAAALFTYTSQPSLADQNGWLLALLWLLSLGLFSFSALRQAGIPLPSRTALLSWLTQNKAEIIQLTLLLALAALLRLYNLERFPYSMVNDEGEMGSGALCLLRGGCPNLFAIAWAAQPQAAYLPYALTVGLMGNTAALPVRLVSAFTGVLSVFFTYLFAREAFGKKTAWVAALLLTTFSLHLHFSRIGVDNIVDSLSSALLYWLILRAARTGQTHWYLAAGIISGLCFYTYPGSRLSVATAAVILSFIIITRRGFLRAQAANLLILILAALITIAPVFGTYTATPNHFNLRLNQVGLFQTGAFDRELSHSGLNAGGLLLRQFLQSSLPFIATPAPINFFNTPRAYAAFIAAIFLMLGLALAFSRLFDVRCLTLLGWFFGPIIVGSSLTTGAPSSQRMLGASPAAMLLAALALIALTQALQNIGPLLKRAAPALLAAILLLNAILDLGFYFGEYRAGHYFEDLSNEITYESRVYTQTLGANGRLYLIGDPMTYIIFGNFQYFLPDTEKDDFNTVTPQALAALPKDKDALFLAIPQRKTDLQNIANWLTGGQWIAENRRCQPQEPLFFIYKVSKEQLQAFHP